MQAFDRHRVCEARLSHWLIAAILTVLGLILSHYQWMMRTRNAVYGLLQNIVSISPFPNVVVVLIGDEEYYSTALAHRQPLKRDYVAALIDGIAKGNPEVIAVDVEMRSPDASHPDLTDYAGETRAFRETVMRVAQQCPIVIAKALAFDKSYSSWKPEADVSDLIPLSNRIRRGYLNLPNDLRQIPLSLGTSNGTFESFPLAVTSAKVRAAVKLPKSEASLPYAVFRRPEFFRTVPAANVSSAKLSETTEWFAHRIVLIGGDWGVPTKRAAKRVDIADTPVGDIPGVYVQATYIESLLHGSMRAMPPWLKIGVECVLAAAVSILFTASYGYWRVLTVIGGSFVILLLTFFFWQNLGMFFEAFVPTVLIGGHVVGEQVIEWRDKANARRSEP